MESFYGCLEPRHAPNPTSFIKNPANSLIPDVSIVLNNSNIISNITSNKENLFTENTLKKQVRFHSASNQLCSNTQPPLNFINIASIDKNTSNGKYNQERPVLLSNALDLSLLDNRNQFGKTTNISKNQEVFAYKKNPKSYHDWLIFKTQQEIIPEQESKQLEPEPTISDLYKIIQVQNNHLNNLQKQVEILLDENATLEHKNDFKSISKPDEFQHSCKCITNPVSVRNTETNTSLNPTQASIGIMTSFEIHANSKHTETRNDNQNIKKKKEIDKTLIRPQNKQFSNMNCSFNNLLTNTIIAEGYSRYKDYSLSEIPEISEPLEDTICSSNSIHVDMQEFPETSDDEESNSSTKENCDGDACNIGWTVYNNVVEQVQNILDKSPRYYKNESGGNSNYIFYENDNIKSPKRSNDLGTSFSNSNITKDTHFVRKQRIESNDLSVEVNQLVMKYLQDDQLSFLVSRNQRVQTSPSSVNKQLHKQNILFSNPQNGNEMSIATIKYMQKYRLWNQSTDRVAGNIKQMVQTQERRSQSKILDITALRQQPKLL